MTRAVPRSVSCPSRCLRWQRAQARWALLWNPAVGQPSARRAQLARRRPGFVAHGPRTRRRRPGHGLGTTGASSGHMLVGLRVVWFRAELAAPVQLRPRCHESATGTELVRFDAKGALRLHSCSRARGRGCVSVSFRQCRQAPNCVATTFADRMCDSSSNQDVSELAAFSLPLHGIPAARNEARIPTSRNVPR